MISELRLFERILIEKGKVLKICATTYRNESSGIALYVDKYTGEFYFNNYVIIIMLTRTIRWFLGAFLKIALLHFIIIFKRFKINVPLPIGD